MPLNNSYKLFNSIDEIELTPTPELKMHTYI